MGSPCKACESAKEGGETHPWWLGKRNRAGGGDGDLLFFFSLLLLLFFSCPCFFSSSTGPRVAPERGVGRGLLGRIRGEGEMKGKWWEEAPWGEERELSGGDFGEGAGWLGEKWGKGLEMRMTPSRLGGDKDDGCIFLIKIQFRKYSLNHNP